MNDFRTNKLSILTLSVLMALHATTALANDGQTDDEEAKAAVTPALPALPTAQLGDETIIITRPTTAVGETVITQQTIQNQNIQNSQDLVRYHTEVDVAEVGRYGNKGFAIRGVDGNRVAVNIDGVALPEVEINEIFSPYGYMFEGRFNPDVELMGSVNITTGADSVLSGSGAVGGAVSYKTKEARHLIKAGENFGGYTKVGYASKNSEKQIATGLAYQGDKAEALLTYTGRLGNETKNHAMRSFNPDALALGYTFTEEEMPGRLKSLIYPQPAEYRRNSLLAKFYYQFTDAHRVGIHGMYQQQKTLMNTDINASFGSRTSLDPRRAHDKEELKSYGAEYRFTPNTSFLKELKIGYTNSEVLGLADTWVYDRSWLDAKQIDFDRREYRPTKTVTDQYLLTAKTEPLAVGKSTHELTLSGGFTNADRSTSATVLKEDGSPNFLNYTFSDVEKQNYHIGLSNRMLFNERLKAMLGVRYDNYVYKPYFENDVFGFDENARVYQTCVTNSATGGFCDAYRAGDSLKEAKFSHTSWSGMLDYQLIKDKLTARYKVGTGFLAPTGTQIYRNFQGLGVLEVPNYKLKPETSVNHELEFEIKPNNTTVWTLAGYVSNYKDFIHTKYWEGDTGGCNGRAICLQSTNLDKAKVHGVKAGVKADISNHFGLVGTLNVSADYHISKDSATVQTDHDGTFKINTLAATPSSLILGADYVSPNKDWEVHARVRGLFRKKAEDTKGIEVAPKFETTNRECPYGGFAFYCELDGYRLDAATGKYTKIDRVRTGYTEYVDTYKHADKSKNAFVVDVFGSKKLGKDKQVTINAGVYNLTNVKYIPWENLRMFSNANVNNMVDADGYGFARYTAPGRNYALSLTYEF